MGSICIALLSTAPVAINESLSVEYSQITESSNPIDRWRLRGRSSQSIHLRHCCQRELIKGAFPNNYSSSISSAAAPQSIHLRHCCQRELIKGAVPERTTPRASSPNLLCSANCARATTARIRVIIVYTSSPSANNESNGRTILHIWYTCSIMMRTKVSILIFLRTLLNILYFRQTPTRDQTWKGKIWQNLVQGRSLPDYFISLY